MRIGSREQRWNHSFNFVRAGGKTAVKYEVNLPNSLFLCTREVWCCVSDTFCTTECNDSLINEQLTTYGTQLLYMVTTEILMHMSAYIMLHLPFRAK